MVSVWLMMSGTCPKPYYGFICMPANWFSPTEMSFSLTCGRPEVHGTRHILEDEVKVADY